MSDEATLAPALAPLADAILHEGHTLFPYRLSAAKNRWRWPFGVAHPQGIREPSTLGCELLVEGDAATEVVVVLRFLQPLDDDTALRSATVGPVALGRLATQAVRRRLSWPAADGGTLDAELECSARPIDGAWVLGSRVTNLGRATPDEPREAWLPRALVSVQFVATVRAGSFASSQAPPDRLADAVAACAREGLWPILIGQAGSCDAVLCAPIVVEDHAAVSPESPHDLGDATEIVELLTLGLRARTDDERREAASVGSIGAVVGEAEGVASEHLARLHGAVRRFRDYAPGVRVRLRPNRRADVFDLALSGRTATIVAIERDLEGRAYVAVTVDDDPGRDLGLDGRPGHRFFFHPDEVDLLEEDRG